MSYRKANYCAKKLANMRQAKLDKMKGREMPPRFDPPEIRRQVFIFDHDFGCVSYNFDLHKTNRIDCYDIKCGEETVYKMMGWNRFLQQVGRAFPRVSSPANS